MIRVRFKSWRALSLLAFSAVLFWTATGWLIMVPWSTHSDMGPRDVSLVRWQLGLVLWLGPAALYVLIWVIHTTFAFEFVNPFKRVKKS